MKPSVKYKTRNEQLGTAKLQTNDIDYISNNLDQWVVDIREHGAITVT